MAKITVTSTPQKLSDLMTPADIRAAEDHINPVAGRIKDFLLQNNTAGETLYVETNGTLVSTATGALINSGESVSFSERDIDDVSLVSGGADIDVRILTV